MSDFNAFLCLQINRTRLLKLASTVDVETELITRNILSDLDNVKKRFEPKIIMS